MMWLWIKTRLRETWGVHLKSILENLWIVLIISTIGWCALVGLTWRLTPIGILIIDALFFGSVVLHGILFLTFVFWSLFKGIFTSLSGDYHNFLLTYEKAKKHDTEPVQWETPATWETGNYVTGEQINKAIRENVEWIKEEELKHVQNTWRSETHD